MSPDLWLPDRYRNAGRNMMLTYLTWSDVSEAPMSEERLKELASSLHTETIVVLVSAVSIILESPSTNLNSLDHLHNQHLQLVKQLCTPDVAAKAERYLKNGRRDVFIHEEQLLHAVRLAIVYGQPGPEEPLEVSIVGELLLGISELIGNSRKQVVAPQDLEISLALRRQALVPNEETRYLIARYFDILVSRARSGSGNEIEPRLDNAFRDATGLTIEEYMAFATMYMAPFFGVASVDELMSHNFLSVLRQYETQIKDPETRERCHRLFSMDKHNFDMEFSSAPSSVATQSFLPFQKHPLFRRADGSAVPISPQFLQDMISLGVYWVLHTYFAGLDRNHGVEKLARYVGRLFESYLTELLRRIYPEDNLSVARFYSETRIIDESPAPRKGAASQPPFDGAIVSGSDLILVEMFSGCFTAKTMVAGDAVGFRSEITRYTEKMRQLCNAIKGISDGRWVIPGLDLRTVRRIYPLLVLLHPYPQRLSTWAPLWDSFILDPSIAPDVATKPAYAIAFGTAVVATQVQIPQIITVEEFEMIEPHLRTGNLSLPELLQRKLNDPQTRYISLKNFLLLIQRMPELPNEEMHALYDAAMGPIRAALGLHLNLEPPGPVDQGARSSS